jgi:Tfp pilus assembly protein PilV
MMHSYIKKHLPRNPRGFTLLVAIIFSSVILSVGLALTDIAYKQVILAQAAQQSQYAFYNADSAMECALEQDQVYHMFDYATEPTGNFTNPSDPACEGVSVTFTGNPVSGSSRITTFSVPCAGGGSNASVQIYKTANSTNFYSNGFNNCNASDPQRLERGLKAKY